MKRTTIYLDPELEVLLKIEMLRTKQPMAGIVREAVLAYVTREPRRAPPGAGQFASGRSDTAERVDDVLADTGFGATPERGAAAEGANPATVRQGRPSRTGRTQVRRKRTAR